MELARRAVGATRCRHVCWQRTLARSFVQKLGVDSDPGVWRTLVETEIEVRRQHERLDEFSDENSPTLKDLKRKLETLQRAIGHLQTYGLDGAGVLEDEAYDQSTYA